MKTIARWGLALAMAACAATTALAQSADCERLRRAIADAGYNPDTAQYQAAADKQQAEIDRMASYAHSIGCENHKFLFFGSDAPAQCGSINQQLGRMRANLADLRARAGGGTRADLVARYNSQCGNQAATNPLDSLFGGHNGAGGDISVQPLGPDGQPAPQQAQSGSQGVCVKTCDGSFFPVTYAANASRYSGLQDLCSAECPNAPVALYTYPFGSSIEQAVTANGQRYVDQPYALKYRQSLDPTCACRKKGESWAQALAGAESRLGAENKGDIIVTPERSAEMSRPRPDAKATPAPKSKKGAKGADQTTDVNGVDTALSAQAQAVSRETTSILGAGDSSTAVIPLDQGQTKQELGGDGIMRRVRVIGPAL